MAPLTISFHATADGSGNATLTVGLRRTNWVKVKMVASGSGSPSWALSTTTGPVGFATGNAPESSPMTLAPSEIVTIKVTGATANSAITGMLTGVEGADYQSVLAAPVFGGTVNVSVQANTNLTQVGGSAISLGQAAPAASIPVVLASGSPVLGHVVTDAGSVVNALLSGGSSPTRIPVNQSVGAGAISTSLLAAVAAQHFWLKGWAFTLDAAVTGQLITLCYSGFAATDLGDFWQFGVGSVGPHSLDMTNPIDTGAAPANTTAIRIFNYAASAVAIRGEIWGTLV